MCMHMGTLIEVDDARALAQIWEQTQNTWKQIVGASECLDNALVIGLALHGSGTLLDIAEELCDVRVTHAAAMCNNAVKLTAAPPMLGVQTLSHL